VKRFRSLWIVEEVKTLCERATVVCDTYVAYLITKLQRIWNSVCGSGGLRYGALIMTQKIYINCVMPWAGCC